MSQPVQTPGEAPWWHEFFDDTYADLALHDDSPEEIESIVSFLIERLGVSAGETVFDQCCGIGRIALPLASRGVGVVGVDLMPGYIDRARAGAEAAGLPCTFHCADAFEFTAEAPCDGAFNWFTSFGYSADDSANLKMLTCALASLKPGRRFIVDIINIPHILSSGDVRSYVRRFPRPGGDEEVILAVELEDDLRRGMIDQRWTFIHPDGRRDERRISARMIMPHELARLLVEAGFVDVELFGSVDGGGAALTRSSRRCIAVARRP